MDPNLETAINFIADHQGVSNTILFTAINYKLINSYPPISLARLLKPQVEYYVNIIITVFSNHPAIVEKDTASEISLLKIIKAVMLDLSCKCAFEPKICIFFKFVVDLIDRVIKNKKSVQNIVDYLIDTVRELVKILTNDNECYVDEEGSFFREADNDIGIKLTEVTDEEAAAQAKQEEMKKQHAGLKKRGKYSIRGKKITTRKKRTAKKDAGRRTRLNILPFHFIK